MSIRNDMKRFYYTFVCFECHTGWWHYCFPRIKSGIYLCTLYSLVSSLRHLIREGKHGHVSPVCSHLIKSRTNVYVEQNQNEIFYFLKLDWMFYNFPLLPWIWCCKNELIKDYSSQNWYQNTKSSLKEF